MYVQCEKEKENACMYVFYVFCIQRRPRPCVPTGERNTSTEEKIPVLFKGMK